jgi:hypothetical protein
MTANPNYDADVTEPEEHILSEAITSFLRDKELCKKYIEQEADRVKAFSTQRYVNAFIELAGEN